MESIPKVFFSLFLFLIVTVLGINIINAGQNKSEAESYKAEVIAEIENSNFSDEVISECVSNAEKNGYTLTVNKTVVDADVEEYSAEVVLGYTYSIPLLNVDSTHYIRGVAR